MFFLADEETSQLQQRAQLIPRFRIIIQFILKLYVLRI